MRIAIILTAASLFLSGCAAMNESECLATDWRSVGFEDGVQGQRADRIGSYRKACGKHGVTPDLAAYRAGRDEGLREYCNADNGYRVGVNGGAYYGVCPSDLDADFADAYAEGRKLYELRAAVRQIDNQINAKENRIEAIKGEILDIEARMISADATPVERVMMLAEAKNLAEEVGHLHSEIEGLLGERARRQQVLDDYNTMMASQY